MRNQVLSLAWIAGRDLRALAPACSSGDSGNAVHAACSVCAHTWYVCYAPGVESVNFQVEQQTSTGCDGHVVQTSVPTTAYTITCDPQQVCTGQQCTPAQFSEDSFSWGGGTCSVTSK